MSNAGVAVPGRTACHAAQGQARDHCGRRVVLGRAGVRRPPRRARASACFQGGAAVYAGAARASLLGIADREMAGLRSSSEPCAGLLARRVRTRFGATWGMAETGAAGPGGNRCGDPAGHTCIAISGPVERVATVRTGSMDRLASMHGFARAPLDMLTEAVLLHGAEEPER